MRIGVDVGTSMVKVVLFDESASPIAVRSSPSPLSRPARGLVENDIEELVDTTFSLIGDVAREKPGTIDLIALTGQGDGLFLLDSRGYAVRTAISWLDARATSICREWRDVGVLRTVFERTANAPFSGAGAAIMAALNHTEPASLDRAATATQCQHAIFERMTSVRTATASCAMLPIFDPAAQAYDDDAVEAVGLSARRSLLPDIAGSPAHVAPLSPSAASNLGIDARTLVATGPYDLPATALGLGVRALGSGVLAVGTTLACQVLVDCVVADGEAVGLTLCAGDGLGWLRAMPAMVGTAGLDWALRLVGQPHAALGEMLAQSDPGASGVWALPYLSLGGERAPFIDEAARGELAGLSVQTTQADVVRAVCEGLGYAARHCFDAAGLDGDVAVCGGGVATHELVQLFADILDRPLSVATTGEPAARGSVLAAALTLGEDLPGPLPRTTIEPHSERRDLYAEGYARYIARLPVARAQWHTSV